MISGPAAGEHGVHLLSGFPPSDETVHGLGGDALGTVDGGGVAETGRGTHIVNRQADAQLAAVAPDGEVTAPADAGDGPAVAVLDPVGGGES
jgi:hypothetical protein